MDNHIFETAKKIYDDAQPFREMRRRNKNYTYGRQWEDYVSDPATGLRMPEGEQVFRSTGRTPLTNNLIRRLVKAIIGRYRSMQSETRNSLSPQLAATYSRNALEELDSRMLEEFLISGCAVQRISCECRAEGKMEIFVSNISPHDFFVSSTVDPRGSDIEMIGVIHNCSETEALRICSGGDYTHLLRFGTTSPASQQSTPFSAKHRIYEVWTLENSSVVRVHDSVHGTYRELPLSHLAELNKQNLTRKKEALPPLAMRCALKTLWHCRIYSSEGKLVRHYTAPSHPFVVKLYPLIDGEIHPFVEEIIDQQRRVNRTLTMIDQIMATSAKGVLLFPEKAKPSGWTWTDVAQRWATSGAVIPYYSSPGTPPPTQVSSCGLDNAVAQLLQTQLNMLNEVSGVGNVLLGKEVAASQGAESYRRQIENAEIALNDLFATFSDFISRRNSRLSETFVRVNPESAADILCDNLNSIVH